MRAFDIDAVPDLCHWENKITGERGKYRSGVGRDWIEAHDWICDSIRLRELLDAQGDNTVVVAGITSNQNEYLDLFDKIFLLYCREETFLRRLNTREGNKFAKEKSEQEYVLSWYKNFEEKMRNQGAIPINTEDPIHSVTDLIMSYTTNQFVGYR